PPFACPQDDACTVIAGALRKDAAAELARNKGLQVVLEEPDPSMGAGAFVLRAALRVRGGEGHLDLELRSLAGGDPLKETFEAQDDDEWALQEALARGVVRFVRRGLTSGMAGEGSDQGEQAIQITHKARRIIHKGTSKHLLIGVSLLRQALEVDRYCALTHAILAEAKVRKFLYWEGDPSFLEEAREHAARSLTLDANCAEAHTALGFAYHLSGHSEDARREYRLAIRLNPGEWFAHRLLGTALVREGNLLNAEPALRQAIRLRPQYIACYDHLYNVLRNLDRREEATALAEQGLQAARMYLKDVPDDLEARLHLGHLAARLGDKEGALLAAKQSLQLAPKDGYTHFHVATIRAICGDADGALDALRTAQDRGYYLKSELGNSDLDLLRGREAFEALAS
ncbi:MAG TPA: tetratricopeptide repeat protein, partial [Planctomycetota bacterium]|nr:tetratricopeptide repeat protein [Planctomycetota bacterium]